MFHPPWMWLFFHIPTAIYLLKCAPPQFGHAGHLHSRVIFRARRFDGGKLGEGPVARRAFLFSRAAAFVPPAASAQASGCGDNVISPTTLVTSRVPPPKPKALGPTSKPLHRRCIRRAIPPHASIGSARSRCLNKPGGSTKARSTRLKKIGLHSTNGRKLRTRDGRSRGRSWRQPCLERVTRSRA